MPEQHLRHAGNTTVDLAEGVQFSDHAVCPVVKAYQAWSNDSQHGQRAITDALDGFSLIAPSRALT